MNRFKYPACGGNQYTSCDTAEGCIYCGHKELKKMETLARRNSMRLIDADALKYELFADNYSAKMTNQEVAECIDNSPTIDAVPVVCGEWKRGREFSSYPRVPFIGDAYYCSNCEEEAYWDTDYGQQLFGFCPNCGAKMEVEP